MSKALNKTRQVEINGKVIIVKKLSIGKIAKLLKKIKQLPQEVVGDTGKTNEQLLQELPLIIGSYIPEYAGAFSTALDKQATEEEIIDTWGLDDLASIIKALVEVNNVPYLMDTLKKTKEVVQGKQQKMKP